MKSWLCNFCWRWNKQDQESCWNCGRDIEAPKIGWWDNGAGTGAVEEAREEAGQ